jgi:hypothetical protein
MAQSPAHKLGQIIGEVLEAAVRTPLQSVAEELGLYLDFKHIRPTRGRKKQVIWTDKHGNAHVLDYVLEIHGSEHRLGEPRAFIETAWRRYTKHSRNKAQEIQGAITPLAETYQDTCPFLGAVLAGVFTQASLDQLKSHRFNVVYCPYETVIEAFASEGIDVSSEEGTSERELRRKVNAFNRLSARRRKRIGDAIIGLHAEQFDRFFVALKRNVNRRVRQVSVLTLSGTSRNFTSVTDAVQFVSGYDQKTPAKEFVRYELIVQYSNGDEVRGAFQERDSAVEFLQLFQ